MRQNGGGEKKNFSSVALEAAGNLSCWRNKGDAAYQWAAKMRHKRQRWHQKSEKLRENGSNAGAPYICYQESGGMPW